MFSDCLLTRGVERSIVADLGQSKYYIITNHMYDFILKFNSMRLDVIKKKTKSEYLLYTKYIHYLVSLNIAEVNNIKIQYNKIRTVFETPLSITNSIVCVSKVNLQYLKKLMLQLNNLGCYKVELRLQKGISLSKIESIIFDAKLNRIKSIELSIPERMEEGLIENICKKNSKLTQVLFFNSSEDRVHEVSNYKTKLFYIKQTGISNKSCGCISKFYFTVNINHLSESLSYNTCLNKKISIDEYGFIKNCPSMKENYGNIKDTTLEKALNNPGLKKTWNIKKDDILVCKDCEFRHICTDCRAYLEDPKNIYGKPLKCGYDPYTGKWEKWSTNPLKQKAIEYYDMEEFVSE